METAGQLGKYRLGAQLAVGGMGEVFLARQEGPAGFSKNVVIKRILKAYAQEPAFVEMFLNEARLAAGLEHPNVVQIFELGEADGTWFIAMEYIHGCSLRRIRQRLVELECPFPPAIAARLCSQALQGLHYAHGLRDDEGAPLEIVHRDVSPDNLLVGFNGVTKVVDFGIAKAAGTVSTTRAGAVKGKFAYMPPEQLTAAPLDGRTDVYAMGVVLYELLTGGVRPFQSSTEPGLMRAILQDSAPPLRAYSPHVPPELEAVVMRAIARHPADRFQTAEDMSVALEAYIHSTGQTLTAAHIGGMLKELFPEEAASRLPHSVGARTPSGSRPPATVPGGATGTGNSSGTGTGHGNGNGENPTTGTSKTGSAVRTPPPSAARWSLSARQEQEALASRGALPAGTPPPMLAVGVREADLPSAVILDIEVDEGGGKETPPKKSRVPLIAAAVLALLLAAGAGAWLSGGKADRETTLAVAVAADPASPADAPAAAPAKRNVQQAQPKAPAPAPVQAAAVADAAPSSSGEAAGDAEAETAEAVEAAGTVAVAEAAEAVAPARDDAQRGEKSPRTRTVRAAAQNTRTQAPVVVAAAATAPATAAPGRVILRVNPWAEVFLGGRSLGITPIDPVVLPPGSHSFVLKNPQLGLEKRLEARVSAGADVVVKADLLD